MTGHAAPEPFVHASATVEDGARLGPGTKVWAQVQIRSGATIGSNCIIGRNCFVDVDVTVGDNVKVQNNSSLYEGVELDDGVFIGPHVIFTNDKIPRAVNPDGSLKDQTDWTLGRTRVEKGAALGAGTVVVTGITIGAWSMIGSGTVVTRSVPAHALVLGNPGRIVGWVSAAGVRCADQDAAVARTELEAQGTADTTGDASPGTNHLGGHTS